MIGLLLAHPILLIFGAITSFVLYSLIFRMYRVRAQLPPGPMPVPLAGNLLLFKGTTVNIGVTISKMVQKYGDPVTIWLGWKPAIFLHTPEMIRKVLIDNPHDFQSRPDTLVGDMFLEGSQDIIFAPYNQLWQFHKKMANKAMRSVVESSALEWHVGEAVDETVTRLLAYKDKPILVRDYTTAVVTCVLASFCFGERMELDHPYIKRRMRIQDRFQELSNKLNLLETVPGIKYIFGFIQKVYGPAKETRSLFDEQIREMKQFVDKHKTTFKPENTPRDILDAIMLEQHELAAEGKANENMDDQHVFLLIFDIFAAGVETTSVTLQWFFIEMVMNPEVQERLYSDITTVIGDERAPQLSDRSSLPFLEACIIETLRIHPVATFGVPTSPIRDGAKIGDYTIPKDAIILTNLMGLHFDPKHWKTPHEFNPEAHFMDSDGNVIKPPTWIPFGVGKRVCLGEQLAKNDLFLITAGLLQKLKFKPYPGETYSRRMQMGNDFNAIPERSYKFTVEAR